MSAPLFFRLSSLSASLALLRHLACWIPSLLLFHFLCLLACPAEKPFRLRPGALFYLCICSWDRSGVFMAPALVPVQAAPSSAARLLTLLLRNFLKPPGPFHPHTVPGPHIQIHQKQTQHLSPHLAIAPASPVLLMTLLSFKRAIILPSHPFPSSSPSSSHFHVLFSIPTDFSPPHPLPLSFSF